MVDMKQFQSSTASQRHQSILQNKFVTAQPEHQQMYSVSKSRSTVATSKRLGRAYYVRSTGGEVQQSDQQTMPVSSRKDLARNEMNVGKNAKQAK